MRCHQDPGGINGPSQVQQGGSITIHVGPNDTVVEIKETAGGESISIPVTPGKDVTIPIPNAPGGSSVTIRVGDGKRNRTLIVEVIAPSP